MPGGLAAAAAGVAGVVLGVLTDLVSHLPASLLRCEGECYRLLSLSIITRLSMIIGSQTRPGLGLGRRALLDHFLTEPLMISTIYWRLCD